MSKILLVHRNQPERETLARFLEEESHVVRALEDGPDALAAARASRFDLVLLDRAVSAGEGLPVLTQLRGEESLRQTPIITLCGPGDEEAESCILMGADDILPKPISRALLRARVGATLERRRLREREQSFAFCLQEFQTKMEEQVRRVAAEGEARTEVLERRLKQMDAMLHASTAMISKLDLDDLLEQIMELSKQVVDADASSLLLMDKEIGKLRFAVARGSAGKELKSATVELGTSIAGWVALSGEPLLIADAYQDPRFNPSYDKKTGFRTRSILTVPVRSKGEILGVVQGINKRGRDCFDEHDVSLFQSFANLAGIAVENAQLFEQTKKMAEDLRTALEQERRLSIEKEKMGRYIPKNLRDEISRDREKAIALGGRMVEATIFFSDIEGFTRLSETMLPQDVVSFLNEYMTAMSNIIDEEGGCIDKFIGDGIMAVFSPNDEHREAPLHALRAVRAGVRMQRKLNELKKHWMATRPEVASLRIRVGINSGEVVAGNIGSQTRMDWTVIGDNVNVASRIESNSRSGEVGISETTYLLVKDQVAARHADEVYVKNRTQPVRIYSVDTDPADTATIGTES